MTMTFYKTTNEQPGLNGVDLLIVDRRNKSCNGRCAYNFLKFDENTHKAAAQRIKALGYLPIACFK